MESDDNVDQYYLLVDFKDVSLRNLSIPKLMMIIPALNTIQVGELHKMVIVNTNWFSDALLTLSMKFITSRSSELLKFFSSDESILFAKFLRKDLPIETLPV